MSRELYDLCRKYKHFYNKHKDVKSWNQKYHDVDLSGAVNMTKYQLNHVEDELMTQLLEDWDVKCVDIHTENAVPFTARMDTSIRNYLNKYVSSESEVSIRDSNRFIGVLAKYMVDWREHDTFY